MKRYFHKKNVYILFIILWIAIIFSSSNMTSDSSNLTSKSIIYQGIEISYHIMGKEISEQRLHEMADQLNYPFRKCMHASVYCILAILTINAFQEIKMDRWKKYMYTILFCFVWAILDELHQLGIVGRTGQILDVFIDTIGCFIGLISYSIFQKITHKTTRKNNS